MQIAVTGGSGTIGRAVIELALAQGHQVVSIDRQRPAMEASQPGISFAEADLTDYQGLEQALRGCDAIVHLAAIPNPVSHPDYVVHNNNVVGSYNVLSAAARLGISRVCQASSVNAIGGGYSRWPRYDYFPLDEQHPSYAEDPYSLSKWICEQQADAFARRYEQLAIASLRFHWVIPGREVAAERYSRGLAGAAKGLWGYTCLEAAARACLLALSAELSGHERCYVIAPETPVAVPSLELAREFFPDVPVRGDLSGCRGFFDCSTAERLLGWRHG